MSEHCSKRNFDDVSSYGIDSQASKKNENSDLNGQDNSKNDLSLASSVTTSKNEIGDFSFTSTLEISSEKYENLRECGR